MIAICRLLALSSALSSAPQPRFPPAALLARSSASVEAPTIEQALAGSTELVESATGMFEVLRCAPQTAAANQTVVVITGNPGLAGFYAGFAESLSAKLQAEVVVLGLAGHVSWSLLSTSTGLPRVIGSSNDAPLPADADARVVFDELDTDGNGAISVSELSDGLARAGLRVSTRQQRAMLRRFDIDASGEIELGEWEAIVAAAKQAASASTDKLSIHGRSLAAFDRLIGARYRTLHALDDQVEHLTEAVGVYVARADAQSRPLTIIGHSIGGWLVSKVLARLMPARPAALPPPLALLLMPFLEQVKIPSESFGVLLSPSESFGVLLIPSLALLLMPFLEQVKISSETFGVLRSPSELSS